MIIKYTYRTVSSLKYILQSFHGQAFWRKIYHAEQKGIVRQRARESEWRIIENRKQQLNKRIGSGHVKTVKNSEIYKELTRYQQAGVELWLDGKPSNSFRIADCVCEKADYMRDYYVDMENRVCGIGFDRIRKDNHGTAELPYAKSLNYYEDFLKKSKYVRRKPQSML